MSTNAFPFQTLRDLLRYAVTRFNTEQLVLRSWQRQRA